MHSKPERVLALAGRHKLRTQIFSYFSNNNHLYQNQNRGKYQFAFGDYLDQSAHARTRACTVCSRQLRFASFCKYQGPISRLSVSCLFNVYANTHFYLLYSETRNRVFVLYSILHQGCFLQILSELASYRDIS